MSLQTVLTRRLGLAHPIIQAPLAGGGDTPELVAAVVEAGALGFIGAAYLTPAQIARAQYLRRVMRRQLKDDRALTQRVRAANRSDNA